MSPVALVLGPGVLAFAMVVALVHRKVSCSWWDYLAPWVAPTIWLLLDDLVPRSRPKSLGNLIEVLGLSMLPAVYVLMRATGWKRRPKFINGFTLPGFAAVGAAT